MGEHRESRVSRVLAVVGVIALVAWTYDLLSAYAQRGRETEAGPVVERLRDIEPGLRLSTDAQLLDWGRATTPVTVVDMARDALQNQLAIGMAPLLVNWQRSTLEGQDPAVLVRNVLVASNPITGKHVLGTARVPIDGLRSVEWCLSPSRINGRDTDMAHAQLRFLFAPENLPVALDAEGSPLAGVGEFDDLILSWEAWRPPQTPWNPQAGLDPQSYALSVRAYTGEQRFLADALRGNPWVCYPLALPEVPGAQRDVLMTSLLMGDAMARRIVEAMAEDGLVDVTRLDALDDQSVAQVEAVFSSAALPEDPLSALMGEADLSYHLLLRSCVTQSLVAVQLALMRTYQEHGLGEPPQLAVVPGELPPWVGDLAQADLNKALTYVPGAMLFVARNQRVLPSRAYEILEDAGLLRYDGRGQIVSYYYHHQATTPYGSLKENLM